MPPRKFLKFDDATKATAEESAVDTSAGAADAGKIPALNSAGRIDPSMLPGSEQKDIVASETLSAGDFVNIFDSGSGVMKMRKADASTLGKRAHGFVLDAVTSGATGRFYGEGINTGQTGLTGGSTVFLSPSNPGKAVHTIPTTAGHILQELGVASTTTEIVVEIGETITRA